MNFIDGEQIEALLDIKDCIGLMRETLIELAEGRAQQVLRTVLPLEGGNMLGIMPAVIGAKNIAGASAARRAEERFEGLGSLVGFVGKVAAELSEQADLRVSRYFPGRVYVGGITLDAGSYSVTVNYYGNRGSIISSEKQENVLVQANKLNLVEFICLW